MNNYYSNRAAIQYTPTYPQLEMKPENHIWDQILQTHLTEFNA